MKYGPLAIAPVCTLLALSCGLANVAHAQALTATSTQNQYVVAENVTVSSTTAADVVALAGTVDINASVRGDVLAAGGTITVSQGATGNVRAAGAKVVVNGPVTDDIAVAGGTVEVNGSARTVYAAGASVQVNASTTGNVTIYGANVMLAGTITGNVSIVASNRLTLGDNTHIHGTLTYSAPEQLSIPASSYIDGGTHYTGAYAYVPTSKQVHQYALLGTALFFIVRILAGSIVAGLILGLFPQFAESVSELALDARDYVARVKYFLLGIAIAVFIPILSLLLILSFVGFGLALVLIASYALLALIGYAFCGIVLGIFLRRLYLYRIYGGTEPVWQDAVVGTFLVHVIGLIPYIGTLLVLLLTFLCVGAVCVFIYRFAFGSYTAV